MTIAVLLATYNRRQKTLACLESLEQQELPEGMELEVFLTDDNSSDGTADAVKALYPRTHVFNGNGHLYWAGGMRSTWRMAMQSQPDYYLLLNDDTLLYKDALKTLVALNHQHAPAICIGSTQDERSGQLSYGGSILLSKKQWKSKMIFSNTEITDCDFANANIMLVPAAVVEKIGILSDRFTHSLADYDYCLRAKKSGYSVKLAPGFLGSCIDDHGKNWKSQQTTLKERIQYLKSPKGLAYGEYLWFIRNHFPRSYPAAFVKLWMKTFFPFIWDRLKKQ
jgi:GT2 family glycosyltransferase